MMRFKDLNLHVGSKFCLMRRPSFSKVSVISRHQRHPMSSRPQYANGVT